MVAGSLLLVLILMGKIPCSALAETGSLEVGGPAPGFSLPDLESRIYSLEDAAADSRYVVLLFWGVWCPFCREIMVRMQDLYKELNPAGLEIIGISMRESPHKVGLFINKLKPDYLVLLDEWAKLQKPYDIRDVPRIVILDRELNVLATRITTSMPVMEEMIHEVVRSGQNQSSDRAEQ